MPGEHTVTSSRYFMTQFNTGVVVISQTRVRHKWVGRIVEQPSAARATVVFNLEPEKCVTVSLKSLLVAPPDYNPNSYYFEQEMSVNMQLLSKTPQDTTKSEFGFLHCVFQCVIEFLLKLLTAFEYVIDLIPLVVTINPEYSYIIGRWIDGDESAVAWLESIGCKVFTYRIGTTEYIYLFDFGEGCRLEGWFQNNPEYLLLVAQPVGCRTIA